MARTVTAPRIVPGLRIPGTRDYLAALTQARLAALAGTPAESALADAAKVWSEISKKHGTARQLWHYRRSLNRLVTDANPPPIGQSVAMVDWPGNRRARTALRDAHELTHDQ